MEAEKKKDTKGHGEVGQHATITKEESGLKGTPESREGVSEGLLLSCV